MYTRPEHKRQQTIITIVSTAQDESPAPSVRLCQCLLQVQARIELLEREVVQLRAALDEEQAQLSEAQDENQLLKNTLRKAKEDVVTVQGSNAGAR